MSVNNQNQNPKPSVPINKIKRFEDFFRLFRDTPKEFKYRAVIDQIWAEGGNELLFLFEDLNSFDSDLAHLLKNDPKEMIIDAIEAFKNMLKLRAPGGRIPLRDYFVRISTKNDSLFVNFKELKSVYIGKLVFTKAMITRISMPQSKIMDATFKCLKCAVQIPVKQIITSSDKLLWPKKCIRPKCSANAQKDFELETKDSEFIDWQKITLQELPEYSSSVGVPRNIDAILTNNLVDSVRPGSKVEIMGVFCSRPRNYLHNQKSSIFYSYIEVVSIKPLDNEYESLESSEEDIKNIIELSKDPKIHQKIIESIAPSLSGYEDLKLAAALSLFGGVKTKKITGKARRSNIHILFVGDPGIGKTELIVSAISLSPKGLYTSGKGASAVGLTAAIVKDESGSMVLEPGVLVLADGGHCGIDELDKMGKSYRSALHESLEQGTVSIAKAGIIRTLDANTTAIAAANPHYGRYNKYKTPAENIKLEPSLLSRFDLIFVVVDTPNPAQDEKIVDFILDQASGIIQNAVPINPKFLKKYIYYARNNCFPQLNKDSRAKIKEVYLDYRKKYEAAQGIVSIVARQAEGLIRLSEAYAKMALRETILVSDVEAVLKVLERSLKDVGYDEDTQKFDIDRIFTGQTQSKIRKYDKILEITKRLIDENNGKAIEMDDLIERLELEDLDEKLIHQALKEFVREGTLYKPRNNKIQYVKK